MHTRRSSSSSSALSSAALLEGSGTTPTAAGAVAGTTLGRTIGCRVALQTQSGCPDPPACSMIYGSPSLSGMPMIWTYLDAKHPAFCCAQVVCCECRPVDPVLKANNASFFRDATSGQMHAYQDGSLLVDMHLEVCPGGQLTSHPHFRLHLSQMIIYWKSGVPPEHQIERRVPG